MNAKSLDRIVVLKDCGIVEQGSHKELLEQDGLFASMWAQQISASEEPLVPKAGAGYDVDEAPVVDIPESEMRSSVVDERIVLESPHAVPASLQSKDAGVGVTFPVSDDTAGPVFDSGPMAFPTTTSTSNTPSVRSHPVGQGHVQGASVTFDAGAINTPPRSGTPEPGSGSGSGRKVAQNFQRLARRISLSAGKGPKLANLPGLRRDSSMISTASASAGASTPASAQESGVEEQGEMSKEERKKKKRKSFMQM